MTGNIPNLHIVNINAYTKFGLKILSGHKIMNEIQT